MSDPRVEARTRELGEDLLAQIERRRPRAAERMQDWLLTSTLADERFRTRMLRFIDVFAAVDASGDAEELHRLLREYFDEDFPGLPRPLRWMLRLGRDSLTPSTAVAEAARRSVSLFARRFITSPHPGAAGELADELARAGRTPSFDLLGEAVLSEAEADAYEAGYLRLIEDLARDPRARQRTPGGLPVLQVSLKLSSLTHRFVPLDLDGSVARVEPRLTRITDAARAAGIGLCVDAEQYATRDVVWGAFRRVFGAGGAHAGWDGAGMVVQAYLRDADRHVDEVLTAARERGVPFQVRLVKGAYWDYETIVAAANRWTPPVFQHKAATDRMYEALLARLVDASGTVHLAVASHNPRSHALAQALLEARGLPASAVEHQTLHRTLEALSEALADHGWPSRDYVPVGDLIPGMAYLVRRILENSSQAGFLAMSRAAEAHRSSDLLAPPPEVDDPATVAPDGAPFARAHGAAWHDDGFRAAFQRTLDAAIATPPVHLPLPEGIPGVEWRAVVDPSHPDGPHLGEVELAGVEGAHEAVRRAAAAAPAWAARTMSERAGMLRRAADLLLAREHEFAAAVVREGGRDRAGALGEVEEAVDFLRQYAASAEELWAAHGDVIAPHGVVAVIPPWNFSLAIPCGMAVAALACGNAVVLKPAEPTPLVAHRLVALLHEAGVPRDVLICLTGDGSVAGRALVEDSDVGMVAFTGSLAVGRWMHEAVWATPRPDGRPRALVTEMGGKNAAVVFSDADLDEAVDAILHSAFDHANQKCSAVSRVLVERSIAARFSERLVEAARSWRVGPAEDAGTSINPVINRKATDRLRDAAAVARREGRVLLDQFGPEPGTFLHGPLIVEIPPERALTAATTTEELFGPILAITPFDSDEQAYLLANGTAYALTSGLFTRSPSRIEQGTHTLVAGHVYVNRTTTAARPGVEPFGGLRLSGTGPKVGHTGYLWAFVRRTDAPEDTVAEAPSDDIPRALEFAPPMPWRASLHERLDVLARAAWQLRPADPRAASAIEAVVAAARADLGSPAPTVQVAGQDTRMLYDTPLGAGVLRAHGERAAWWLAAALAAGNGLAVLDSPALSDAVRALLLAGVPEASLRAEPSDARRLLAAVAVPGVDFAAVDVGPYQPLARSLGPTPEDQHSMKALLSPLDGPQPGEPGFVRRFAWPRVIAVRTLRHGADLGFEAT